MVTVIRSPIDSDVDIIHSTFEDNPFLDKDYIDILQDLIKQDANYYRIYALGEWGLLTNRIYNNYTVIPELPDLQGGKWAYGLDFGLVNPSAIAKVHLLNDRIYVEERLFKSGLTNADIIEHFSHEERGDIYGDPSAKQMLAEIRQAGYACYEGHKGVKDGIDLCQRQQIYIPESSSNLIREIGSYHWKKDRDGHTIGEPVKFNDHLVDAMRYAIFGLVERYGFPTRRPGIGGPIESLTFKKDKILKIGKFEIRG